MVIYGNNYDNCNGRPASVTLSDFQSQFSCLETFFRPLQLTYFGKCMIYLLRQRHIVMELTSLCEYDVKFLVDAEGLLKVIGNKRTL